MIRKDCICFFNNLCLWDVLFRTACFVKGIVHNTFNFPNVRQTAIGCGAPALDDHENGSKKLCLKFDMR